MEKGGQGRSGRVQAIWLALALTCLLGFLFKSHCLAGGWRGAEQYTTGCYSDVVPFWEGRQVRQGKVPYLEARMEYPVLTGAQIWVEGVVTRALFGRHANDHRFLLVVTLANALLAAQILRMFLRVGVERGRLWAWAAAPPLVLYLGHNWDMAAAALAIAALLFARSGRLVPAAATAALGAAAKLFPVLALPLIGLQALFGRGGWRDRLVRAAGVTAAAIAAWVLVNLPIALLAWDNWSEFYRFSQARQGTAGATWEVLANSGLWVTWTEQRNLYAAALFLGGCALIVALGWRRHRDHFWVLFTPVLAWFLLTNKVYSPQFDLWLYPVLLLTAPRLLPLALFVAGGIAAYFAEFWWFAGLEGAWPAATPAHIAYAAAIRGAAMLWIIGDCVLRRAPRWVENPHKA